MEFLESLCLSLRKASVRLAVLNTGEKNRALAGVAAAIDRNRVKILSANEIDVQEALKKGTKKSLVDRLSLSDKRIDDIISGINVVINQKDPVGECESGWKIENGLRILKTRVPLGVAAIIYESRPNVTVEAFSLAYKSGNSILLRGSSSALNSNKAIVEVIKEGLAQGGGIPESIELAASGSREEVDWMLKARGLIDVLLPRGSSNLINMVVENSRVPVIETGAGNCHVYAHKDCDVNQAVAIIKNAKLQRPGVCNAMETLLVHRDAAGNLLPELSRVFALEEKNTGCPGGAKFHCDEYSMEILKNSGAAQELVPATTEDWAFEYLDYEMAIKTVSSLEEAVEHINRFSTKHSEAILTKDFESASYFQKMVDSACVYVNASTRFTDGGVFGFGAELGISTQKLHARGPMGMEALTTVKYLIDGNGQVR